MADVPAPEPAQDRLPGGLFRPGSGHRRARDRQDGHPAAPGGLPRRQARHWPGTGHRVQRHPRRLARRATRPADPERGRPPPDRGAERGPACLRHRSGIPWRARDRGRADAARAVGGCRRPRAARPHPGVHEERVGAGHPGSGAELAGGVPELPARGARAAARQGAARRGLAGGAAGQRRARRFAAVNAPAAGQRGRAPAPRGGSAALPAHPGGRRPGPAPVSVAAAPRGGAARPGRPVHRGRPAPAHLQQPGLPRQPADQRARAQPPAVAELPDHPGDPHLGGAAARHRAGHRHGRRGRLAARLPFADARAAPAAADGFKSRGGVRLACRAGPLLACAWHRAAVHRGDGPVG